MWNEPYVDRPTEDEIRAACREFQSTWSYAERVKRSSLCDIDPELLYALAAEDPRDHAVRLFSFAPLDGRGIVNMLAD